MILVLLASWAFGSAVPLPPQTFPGLDDPRIQTIQYSDDQVFRLRVAAGYQLTLLFASDERVENVALGDSDAWAATVNGRGDAIFVKPVDALGPTNMTVITDNRVYNFELVPTGGGAPDAPFTVRFSYLPDEGPTPSPAMAAPLSGSYRLSGSRDLLPRLVFDDGSHTYIEWRERQSLPAVFGIDDQGQEIVVNGHMRAGRYVIDDVYTALRFRSNRRSARGIRVSAGPLP